ncbi:jerky protein homolog-like isoform X2 [Diprion similis]|uniref:jerky protein homolog-like isoform X2 n=1 Tax=Diprion similis TaxID=362088 RepID=UPI001EF84332|nr:jerky protein homolog-like isoform X2 [Diprion similis]
MQVSNENELKVRKRKNLTVHEKLKILKTLDNDVESSTTTIAQEYGIDPRTIRNWRQNRQELEKLSDTRSMKIKRVRKSRFEQLEKALYTWFQEIRFRGVPVNGPIIRAKALELSKAMEDGTMMNFVASEGWLSKWKSRFDIQKLTSDNKAEDEPGDEIFVEEFPLIIKKEEPGIKNVHVDENDLYYQMLSACTSIEDQEREAVHFKQNKVHNNKAAPAEKNFIQELPIIVKQEKLSQSEIYTNDESNLNHKALPSNTMAKEKNCQPAGSKQSKTCSNTVEPTERVFLPEFPVIATQENRTENEILDANETGSNCTILSQKAPEGENDPMDTSLMQSKNHDRLAACSNIAKSTERIFLSEYPLIEKAECEIVNTNERQPSRTLAEENDSEDLKFIRRNDSRVRVTGYNHIEIATDRIFIQEYPLRGKDEELVPSQIFNATEADLYYKMLPSRNLAEEKDLEAMALHQNKDRVTVMACYNSDASLKLPLIVIGRYPKPRALKNMSKSTLPVYYTGESSAMMTINLFKIWFKEVFVPQVTTFLRERGLPLKAELLVNNATSDSRNEVISLNDIKAYYLPHNKTSVELSDHGTTDNLKRHYTSALLRSILYAQQSGTSVGTHLKSVNIRDVIYWLSDAWDEVSPSKEIVCHQNPLSDNQICEIKTETTNLNQGVTDQDLLNLLQQIDSYKTAKKEIVHEWIKNNDNAFAEMPTNEEIIKMVEENDELEEDEANLGETVDVKPKDVVTAANTILAFFERHSFLTKAELATIRKVKRIAMQIRISQQVSKS